MRRAILTGVLLTLTAAAAQAGAAGYFPETMKDFGTTPRGPVLVHYFPVKNTSGETVNLGVPRVSCGCVSASILKYTLAPGESTAVVAAMDTRRIPQAGVTRTVTVDVPVQTGFMHEEAQLRVSAIARDDLILSTEAFAFGTVRKGQGGTATTKLTFYSDPNWQITEAASTGIYVKAAVKPAPKAGTESSFELTATLDPACPVGNWTADVWVRTSAPGVERLRIPVTVNVVAPIEVKPEAVRFGDLVAGKKVEQKVILQAGQAFKILEVKGATDGLEVTPAGPTARPVHILAVTFTPKKPGDYAHKLEIVTDHPDMKTVVVPLSGKVTADSAATAVKAQ